MIITNCLRRLTAVIEKCSRKVQEAVENNTDISDLRGKKEVTTA